MSMISIEGRPKSFSEVAGQNIAKSLLKSVCKDPENSPKVIQLYGGFGCGKTTLARIFAAAVNNMKYEELSTSPFLQELDSSQLNKDTINQLIETWYVMPRGGYRVIIIDENHLLSKQVQSALLKVLEDMPKNTFIVFATTDYDKVLDTIKSRSLEIKLEPVGHDDMMNNLKFVAEKFNIPFDEDVFERIIQVSHGHMRSAHMALSKYEMLGKEQYLSLFKSTYSEVNNFVLNLARKNKEGCFKAIDEMLQFPLVVIQEDVNKYMLDLMKAVVTEPTEASKALGSKVSTLVRQTQTEWFKNSYTSDVEFQTAMLCLMNIMLDLLGTTSTPTSGTRPVAPGARR